jgi:Protein of unknown function (DUF2911)
MQGGRKAGPAPPSRLEYNPRMSRVAALLLLLTSLGQQPAVVKPSQHGTVTQQVAATTITVDYNRPVARGRELFGALVPFDKVWCPGADDCTTLTVSTEVKIEGKALAAGTYSLWAKPGAAKWSIIVNRAHPIFHTRYATVADQDLLTLEVTPRAGSAMETLAFYFPIVEGRHAELVLHWGTVVVPLAIDVP